LIVINIISQHSGIIMDEEVENAYEILGVAEHATTPEIHKAYIKLCRQWHPDKGRTEADIRERTIRMFQLNAARAILTDNVKRAVHDAVLQSRRDGTYEPPDRGSGYKNEGGFRFSSKPRPSGLATPYRGDRTTPETYECRSDGTDGIDGLPGRPGWGGNGYGGHGT
jgi:molecular chaperone DnaJ